MRNLILSFCFFIVFYDISAFDYSGIKLTRTLLKMDSPSVNINLNNVKNMRDIASASSSIKPIKILRTGCVS
jgi:hypothetical protein